VKKKWSKPKLTVLERGALGESVLAKCFADSSTVGGPSLCCQSVGPFVVPSDFAAS
jgi:hypothetical protein